MIVKTLTLIASLCAIVICSDYRDKVPMARLDILNAVIGEAASHVDRAIHRSQEYFEDSCPRTAADFHILFRYPPPEAIEMTRSQDILEEVVEMMGSLWRNAGGEGSHEGGIETLTPEELKYLIEETGCMAYRFRTTACEESMCFHARYRSPDGTCNNFRHPNRGSSLQPLARLLDPVYENGVHTPLGWTPGKLHNGYPIPLARTVTSEIITSFEFTEHAILTGMTVVWGQFLAHDMSLSIAEPSHISFAHGKSCSKVCENVSPCFPIQLPADDPRRPEQTCLEFTRSGAVCGTGQSSLHETHKLAREQLNGVNSYLDASHVYGNSDELAQEMRDFDSTIGLLEVGQVEDQTGRPILPLDDKPPLKCFADETKTIMGPCFKAGDIRANEIPPLTSLHILFHREHNRIATALARINPRWDGETIYQETKKIVGALFQHITFSEYLPSFMGEGLKEEMGGYAGYDPELDASSTNVFATMALRCGHAFIAPVIARLGPDYEPIPEGNFLLHQGFFQPWRIIKEGGIDPIIRGLFAVGAKDLNSRELVTSELTEHLFETSDRMALDLESLDIQRGRDHGLPSYNDWREFCGLGRATKFNHLRKHISNKAVLRKFRQLYHHPDNIDVFIGALVEDPLQGAVMGPLAQCLFMIQLKKTRHGDRFWYENPGVFTSAQLEELKKSSLARMICDNTDIDEVQTNVFLKTNRADYKKCVDIPAGVNLEMWRQDGRDKKAPKITCPGDVVLEVPPTAGGQEWIAIWEEPTVSDTDENVSIVSSRQSGDAFPEGVTIVTYSASDSSGNCATCSFSVDISA